MTNASFHKNSFVNDLNEFRIHLTNLSLNKYLIEKCLNDVFQTHLMSEEQEVDTTNHWARQYYTIINCIKIFLRVICSTIFIITFIYFFIMSHSVVQKFIMRNSQNYIYPIMRSLRLWTLPLITKYDILTDWHEEECLIKNPLYHETSVDCWPCEDIRTLVDLTGLNNYSNAYVYNEQPFIVRDSLNNIFSFQDLQELYNKNSLFLDRGISKFMCSKSDFCSPRDVLTTVPGKINWSTFQVTWKINRVSAARIFRKLFSRPYFVPNTSEVALERFLHLSGSHAPQFYLPLTDFANVWLAQGQGYRLIVLDPSQPCMSNCSTVSVLLRPKDVLYYNWQFWRPRSLPAKLSEDISITYIGSFY